jgi:hypothetical protein
MFLDLDCAWMYGWIVVNFLFVTLIACDRKNVGFFVQMMHRVIIGVTPRASQIHNQVENLQYPRIHL